MEYEEFECIGILKLSYTKELITWSLYQQPQAVKGKEISKASGGVRLLGIPTVMDRLIQQSIHQVLNEIWDYGFSKFSYGFRPTIRNRTKLGETICVVKKRRMGDCL